MALPLSYNVKSVRARWPIATLAVVGIALVVAVVTVLLAMAQGFAAALRGTGRSDNVMITSRGANSEVTSFVELEERNAILDQLGAAPGPDGRPLVSWEWVSVVAVPRPDGRRANVVLRSVTPEASLVRTGIRMIDGRPFRPGSSEVVVGRRIRDRLPGLQLGSTLRFRRKELLIVGVFASEGAAFESEVWADFDTLRSTFRRPAGSNSLVIRVRDEAQIAALDRWIRLQPDMLLRAVSERQYYEEQAGPVANTLKALGLLVAAVMGVGAVFASMNTMYRIVASRSREIGTLRAVGFSRRAILFSFVVESALLGLAGGILGCLAASFAHGYSTGTANLQSLSELAFAFRITPPIVASSLGFALLMGILGGSFPRCGPPACPSPRRCAGTEVVGAPTSEGPRSS